jgi:hypothetical protein
LYTQRTSEEKKMKKKAEGAIFENGKTDLYYSMIKPFIFSFFLFCVLFGWLGLHAAAQNEIVVSGMVFEENGQPLSNIIIINQRTKHGSFGKPGGYFEVSCLKTDTLTLTSLGYFSRSVCMKDSTLKSQYKVRLFLEPRSYNLPQAEIFAPRDLEDIQQDIKQLGFDEEDYMLSGINAIQSPITFLYQQLSRKEQSKRAVAEMVNDDKRVELLKELFHHYVDYQIIELNAEEFDEFIRFINVTDEFMKTTTQYDFLIFVKERFMDYKVWRRQKRLNEVDYDYDKD